MRRCCRSAHAGTALLAVALASLAAGAALAAKRGPQSEPQRAKTQPGDETSREGTIAVVRGVRGGEPQLTERDGKRWLLIGALQQELLRLGGHALKVWGVIGRDRPVLPTVSVRRYELLDAGGGKKPLVGVLQLDARKRLQLHQADDTVLTVDAKKALLAQLKRRLGCKVWLVGELSGDTLRAHKFGWLNCAKQRPLKAQKETSK